MAGYPPTHRRRARACKRAAGDRCSQCGQPNRTLGVNKRGQPMLWFLHAAHVNHDTRNPQAEYLCLCPTCHQAYDDAHRAALRQLDRKLRAELARPASVMTPEEEQAILERLAQLQAQEQADFKAWQSATGIAEEEQHLLQQRALWARCKHLRLALHLARLVVAHLHRRPPLTASFRRQMQDWYRGKRDAYQLALEAYRRAAPSPAARSSVEPHETR